MKIAIRVIVGGICQSEEVLDMTFEALTPLLPRLAEKHCSMMIDRTGMVEIEFLDEPDGMRRFFRIGTDPSQMVAPVAVCVHCCQPIKGDPAGHKCDKVM